MASTTNLKIIFTTDTIHRGGKERQLFILTRNLLVRGFDIGIITKKFSKQNYLREYGLSENIIKIYDGDTIIEKYKWFKKIAIFENPDFIISWDLQTSFFSLILSRKYSFIFINASIQHGIRLLRISHIFRSIVCLLSPYVIANSYAGLNANNLKPGKRRFVLYNGIESKFCNSLSKTERENRRFQMIPGYSERQGTIFITIANLVPYKDYFTVLKALRKIKEISSFYYFIIGDGPMHEDVIKSIKEQGLENNVIMTGRIEDLREYLFISDIMVHSSRGEGISNAILEGMYAGLPVIASNVGGIPETVFPASSMLFPYRNVKILMECLLRAPFTFKGFDKNSEDYKKHLNNFSEKMMIRKFNEILKKVMIEAKGFRQKDLA